MSRTFFCPGPANKRAAFLQAWTAADLYEGPFEVVVREAKRTSTQNAKMWPMLRDFARQVDWPHTGEDGNWVIAKMPEMSWKSVLTAGFEKETAMAQGWDGGSVMVGVSTSDYGVRRMAEFIDWLYAAGSQKDVAWSEKSLEAVRLYGTALREGA